MEPHDSKPKLIAKEEFYFVTSFLLKLVGVPTNPATNRRRFTFLFWALIIFDVFQLILQIIYNQQLIVVPGAFDLSSFSFVVSCVGYQSIALAKALSIAIGNRKLNHLFRLLHEVHPNTKDAQIEYEMPEWILNTKRLMLRYSFMHILMIAAYLILPMYGYIKVLVTTGTWKMDLPLRLWYPFDVNAPSVFYAIYLQHSICGFSASIFIALGDLQLLGIVNLICAHFDHLKRKFRDLDPAHSDAMKSNNIVQNCVIKHNQIIKLCEELDGIFSVANLVNYITSSTLLCTMGFLIMVTGINSYFLIYAFSFLTSICQVFVLAWMGEKIMESSISVADGIYLSEWHMTHLIFKKSLKLIAQRSQRPQHLSLFKFGNASYDSFSNVLTNSWRLLTILNTMYAK